MARSIAQILAETIFARTLDVITRPDIPIQNTYAERVASEITKEVAPVIQNATNSEPLWQSRVAIGSVGSVLAALADLAAMYAAGDWDQQRIITDLVVLSGAAFALYGRIRGAKLKPLGK